MKRTLLATLSVIAIVAASTQFADAAQRKPVRKPAQASAATNEQFRNSNAAWPAPTAQPDIYRYSGGWSAPAGH
jgi:hypothetical protein